MGIKEAILDKVLQWFLESKVSPIGWLNGYKALIGTILTVASGIVLAVQQGLLQFGVCPGWEFCPIIDQTAVLIAFLLSLLVKLVGEWHKKDKILRANRIRPPK